jgi:hypothetical protein
MNREGVSLERALEAFRAVSAAPADGAATRARVLARAGSGRRGRALGRAGLGVAAAVVLCSSASVAWTLAAGRPSHVDSLALEADWAAAGDPAAGLGRTGSGRPSRSIPAEPAVASGEAGPDREARIGEDPARAVRLWDIYLKAHPNGTFTPEARFNRALDLIRSSRFEDARRALQRFADGPLGSYRQHDAAVLLDWVAARGLTDGSAEDGSLGAARQSGPPATQKSTPPDSE